MTAVCSDATDHFYSRSSRKDPITSYEEGMTSFSYLRSSESDMESFCGRSGEDDDVVYRIFAECAELTVNNEEWREQFVTLSHTGRTNGITYNAENNTLALKARKTGKKIVMFVPHDPSEAAAEIRGFVMQHTGKRTREDRNRARRILEDSEIEIDDRLTLDRMFKSNSAGVNIAFMLLRDYAQRGGAPDP